MFDDGCAAEEFDAVVVDIALCDDAKEIKDFEKKKDKKNKNKMQNDVFSWGGWNPRFSPRFGFRGWEKLPTQSCFAATILKNIPYWQIVQHYM